MMDPKKLPFNALIVFGADQLWQDTVSAEPTAWPLQGEV